MTLHLLELPLALPKLHEWAVQRNIGGSRTFDEGLVLHHLLGKIFGTATVQPFRLMVAPRARNGTLYAYASESAEALRGKAQLVLEPTESTVFRLDRLRSLPRPAATWRTGMRLGFDLRIRPVVQLASAIPASTKGKGFSKGAELDAFLAETLRANTPISRPREAVYMDWLAARLSPAADLDRTVSRLATFRRSRINRNGKTLDGPDVVIHGTLTLRDPDAFAATLAKGVGRHRAYGYGMLLLRPPQRQTTA